MLSQHLDMYGYPDDISQGYHEYSGAVNMISFASKTYILHILRYVIIHYILY